MKDSKDEMLGIAVDTDDDDDDDDEDDDDDDDDDDDYYQPLDVLNSFIQSMADANDFARIINIGQSYEGRDMKVLAVEKVSCEN